jgi:hypothetical protein
MKKYLHSYFAYRNIKAAVPFVEDSDKQILNSLLAKYAYVQTDEIGSFVCTQCNDRKPLSEYPLTPRRQMSVMCSDCHDRATAISQIKQKVCTDLTQIYYERIERATLLYDFCYEQICCREKCPGYIKHKRIPHYLDHRYEDPDFAMMFYKGCENCYITKRINCLEDIQKKNREKIRQVHTSFDQEITEEAIQTRIIMTKINLKLKQLKKEKL